MYRYSCFRLDSQLDSGIFSGSSESATLLAQRVKDHICVGPAQLTMASPLECATWPGLRYVICVVLAEMVFVSVAGPQI